MFLHYEWDEMNWNNSKQPLLRGRTQIQPADGPPLDPREQRISASFQNLNHERDHELIQNEENATKTKSSLI
jgi:hypothetical protein